MNFVPGQARFPSTGRFAAGTLVALHLCAIFAGFLSPHPYARGDDRHGFHPPMLLRIRVIDEQGAWSRPFVYGIAAANAGSHAENRAEKHPLRLFPRGEEYSWMGLRCSRRLLGVDAPGRLYLLGTDQFGRDLLARILHGAQTSLSIGLLCVALSMGLGLLIGGSAGWRGGRVDFLLMRLVELMLAIPSLYAVLILRRSFGDELTPARVYLLMVLLFTLTGWAPAARLIRGLFLGLKEREYALAARAMGAGSLRIVVRHLLPNALPAMLAAAARTIPFFILGEVSLSFLGLGVQEPEPSWGNLLAAAQNLRVLTDFSWLLLPGAFIFLAVLAWIRLAEALQEAISPERGGR
ncbi:MAG: ABC transporter permease [Blastocatellia bacterium]|nr:ABC transporter permease [Blastocatellia bacterium]